MFLGFLRMKMTNEADSLFCFGVFLLNQQLNR